MAHNVSICETDVDYENLGEGEPAEGFSFHLINEPATSTQECPETVEMEDFRECTDIQANRSSYTSDESLDRQQISSLQRHCWSAATVKVLASMPSRTAGLNNPASISCRARHQASSRESHHRSTPIQDASALADMEEINTEDQLVSSLRGLSLTEGTRKLRAMPLSLADKMEIRKAAFRVVTESSLSRSIPCYTYLSVYISRTWRHCLFSCLPVFSSLKLWHSAMKTLSARYGTGVLSYFLFLRTLLFFNLLLFVITGLFLIMPQAINPPTPPADSSDFSGLELLTGKGYFSQSLMFYGYYSNITTRIHSTVPYSIPVAYLLAIAFAFFIICIILVYRLSKSFGRNFQALQSNRNLALKVFSCWDFKVTKKTSVRLQSEKISTQLKEQLSEMIRGEDRRTCMQQLCCLMVHLLAWAACLVSIALGTIGVHYLPEGILKLHKKNLSEETELLLLSAVVSGINLLLPGFFNLCVWAEKYESPAARVYVSIFRNLLLKVSVIAVLCYRWLERIPPKSKSGELKCWENFVGQELYRLLVMDFIFTVLYTFLGEFLWRIFSKKMLKKNRKPVFDIARGVLELTYGQTLTWIGVLFAPLLPAVQLIKLFVLFYLKKRSLILNCQASKKPWRATQMTTLFTCLLWFPSFLGAVGSVIYTVWIIKPSEVCGPFRNLTTMFEAGQMWTRYLEDAHPILKGLSRVYDCVIENPVLLFLVSGVMLMVIYFQAQVVDGQRKIISRLEKQIENEGKDKTFLIAKLQDL
ncbi:transmembrane channel-like protein 6 [Archocentrus centrarchus]|uniref:transmembrane channel-like protein 6 n=1 Tax=Archocentrus centrarchus TaxID=63155 RepID=UPI0011EA0448|nr:transmembrane channel-like protein 6 [Archocentrus centrarchus]